MNNEFTQVLLLGFLGSDGNRNVLRITGLVTEPTEEKINQVLDDIAQVGAFQKDDVLLYRSPQDATLTITTRKLIASRV